ncbi:unnamed protein product [Cyclocybe aegerita]|uniref:Transmembrane protein n=1 Tax=Cyclocybe aegerita TaxID=1973307 RepID=A0A8S0WVG9_CYCAE|nr:unnamed protein product [Cyclocybe aegerita]
MVYLYNRRAILGAIGIWAISSLPTASAALSWSICETDEDGKKTCRSRIPRSARIAIGIMCLGVLLLLASLVVCCIKNRRAAKQAQQEVNVEANQVDGPPTIIATEYHPTAGPSPVYSPRPGSPAQMSGPAYPVAAHYYKGSDTLNPPEYGTRTAPVSQGAFQNQPYPFSGGVSSTSRGATVPKTAFVTGGFPRPLLAGERLKDRLKERPASVSHSSYGLPPSPRSPRPN